jgi:ATP-binding cassette subfamily F protein uup
VLVSHDRDLMDRLCTEVIGLDDRGNAAPYGSVQQWLNAYEKAENAEKAVATKAAKAAAVIAPPKTKKLSYKEQQELDGMENILLAAEDVVAQQHAAVEKASTAGHVALAEACKLLEDAEQKVSKLYNRWAELEAKKN